MLPSYSLPYVQVTCCGLTAQAVQTAVTSITVINQGPRLSYWPPAVCQFTNITSINLSGNAITFIPQSIQELQGLQQLLISRNDLGSLPPEIGALTALTELDVGANKISKLPDALCKLTGLEVCIALAFNFACRCGVGWPSQGGVRVGDGVKAVLGSQGPAPAPATQVAVLRHSSAPIWLVAVNSSAGVCLQSSHQQPDLPSGHSGP